MGDQEEGRKELNLLIYAAAFARPLSSSCFASENSGSRLVHHSAGSSRVHPRLRSGHLVFHGQLCPQDVHPGRHADSGAVGGDGSPGKDTGHGKRGHGRGKNAGSAVVTINIGILSIYC